MFAVMEGIYGFEFVDSHGRSLYVEGQINRFLKDGFRIISVHEMDADTADAIADYNSEEVKSRFILRYQLKNTGTA